MSHAKALAASRQHCCLGDIDFIWELLRSFEPARTVILGAGSGTMTLACLEERNGPDWLLLTIDHNADALHWERTALQNVYGALPSSTEQWFMDSVRAASIYAKQRAPACSVNMLIVDTAHTYGHTCRELDAWLPLVPVGGVVMLHDYDAQDAPRVYPGVQQAADEYLVAPTWLEIGRGGWSGAWVRAQSD